MTQDEKETMIRALEQWERISHWNLVCRHATVSERIESLQDLNCTQELLRRIKTGVVL